MLRLSRISYFPPACCCSAARLAWPLGARAASELDAQRQSRREPSDKRHAGEVNETLRPQTDHAGQRVAREQNALIDAELHVGTERFLGDGDQSVVKHSRTELCARLSCRHLDGVGNRQRWPPRTISAPGGNST